VQQLRGSGCTRRTGQVRDTVQRDRKYRRIDGLQRIDKHALLKMKAGKNV
jgi:hypothetical protein